MTPSGKALIASISTLGLVGLVIVMMSLAGLKPPGAAGVIFAGLGLLLLVMVPVMSLFVMSQSPQLREPSEDEAEGLDKVVYTPASFRPAGTRASEASEDTPYPMPMPEPDVFATQDSRMLIEHVDDGMRSDLVSLQTGELRRPAPADFEALFGEDVMDLAEYFKAPDKPEVPEPFGPIGTDRFSESQIAVRRAVMSGALPSPFDEAPTRMSMSRPASSILAREPSKEDRSLEARTREATGLSQEGDPFSETPTEMMSRDVVQVLRSASSSEIKAVGTVPLLDDLLEDGPDPWGLAPTNYNLEREVERVKKDFIKEQSGAPDSGMMKIARFLDDLSGDGDSTAWRALATDSVEIPVKSSNRSRATKRKTLSGGFKSSAPFARDASPDVVTSQESVIVFLGVGDIGETRPDALKHSPDDDESTYDLNPISETEL